MINALVRFGRGFSLVMLIEKKMRLIRFVIMWYISLVRDPKLGL